MIEYKGLPQRVRRIVKVYEYCIESVIPDQAGFVINLKSGYQGKNGSNVYMALPNSIEVIEFLKGVTKPSTRDIKVALYGFECPICSRRVSKGSNYTSMGGLNLCSMCG